MPYIKIDKERCKGCLLCAEVCPKKLIKISGKTNKRGAIYVEAGKGCTACAMCAVICPESCIEVYK